jgi:hypothetical protein
MIEKMPRRPCDPNPLAELMVHMFVGFDVGRKAHVDSRLEPGWQYPL